MSTRKHGINVQYLYDSVIPLWICSCHNITGHPNSGKLMNLQKFDYLLTHSFAYVTQIIAMLITASLS